MAEEQLEKNTITMEDSEGNKIEVEILFSYNDEETGKLYVFMVDYNDETIIIGELREDDSLFILGPETDDDLKDKLEEVYQNFMEDQNARFVSEEVVDEDDEVIEETEAE